MVDLVNGPNEKLFRLPTDGNEIGKCLDVVTGYNNAFSQLFKPLLQEPAFQPSQKQQKKRMWKQDGIRNRATLVLGILFGHFGCETPHEVLLKITKDSDENSRLSSLQLILASCPELESLQEVRFDSGNLDRASITSISDICTVLRQHAGQGKALTLLIEEQGLFGAWADPTSSGTIPPTKESIDQLIRIGAFRPLDLEMLTNGASPARFSIKDKRTLAVKLGYCLMDFFDADLSSKRIYFLNSSRSSSKKACPYLAFGSMLPVVANSSNSSNFQMGHPTLLSFAKLLLEIDFGQSLELDISPDSSQNHAAWAKLLYHVECLEKERIDSYLQAISGCLNVYRKIAKKLMSYDTVGKDTHSRIRKILFKEVVHKLELGLAESIPRTTHKRQRSKSPSTSGSRDRARAGKSWEMVIQSVEPQRPPSRHKKRRTTEVQQWSSHTNSRLSTVQTSSSFDDKSFDCKMSNSEAPIDFDRPNRREGFEIALLCALQIESDAVEALFDDYYEKDYSFGKAPGDPNAYTTGRMSRHNVVLAFMPGMGKVNSANVAASIRASFPGIKLGIVVGICGGVPNGSGGEDEVLLGDVIISTGLIQFDFGRQYENKAVRRDTLQDNLGRPNAEIRAFLIKLSGLKSYKTLKEKTSSYLEELCGKDGLENSSYPGADNDTLYLPSYRHEHRNPDVCNICQGPHDQVCDVALDSSCTELRCQDSMTVSRARVDEAKGIAVSGPTLTNKELREAQKPMIHFGVIVSGDSVMKSGRHRDEIASREKAIAFEMEGAGVWDNFPTVVIKGVCDYADSHKNKRWQGYAAATAAACMKAFLEEWR